MIVQITNPADERRFINAHLPVAPREGDYVDINGAPEYSGRVARVTWNDANDHDVTLTIELPPGEPAAPPDAWWRSWPVHNLIAHPASEILSWLGLGELGNRLHDATVPNHHPGTGRG